MQISIGIPTKNRYEVLDKTLLSIAFQTLKPLEVIIVDDSDSPVDIRTIQHYEYILRLFDDKGIAWKVIYGQKKGQHYSHQTIQEEAKGDLIFRIDDDEVAEPDVLEKLHSNMERSSKLGAIAPAVLMPNASILPSGLRNEISNLDAPNVQWFRSDDPMPRGAEHLYSCFLYRKGIQKYDLSLSTVAHREETIFTHSIYRAGYSLAVDLSAKVYHFRAGGGIRTFQDPGLWEHDERIFQGYLNRWGVKVDKKMIVLDNGLGDHWAFKNILESLKEKHKNITIACCYPEVFHDEPSIKLISIAEAKLIYGNIDNFNIYKWMEDHQWKKGLSEAFKALYLNENNSVSLQPKAEKREGKPQELPHSLLAKGYKLVS